MGQRGDEVVGLGEPCGLLDRLVRGVRVAVRDVLPDAPVEQEDVLAHEPDVAAELP